MPASLFILVSPLSSTYCKTNLLLVSRETRLNQIANTIHAMEQERERHMRQASELTASLESARKQHSRIQNSLKPISALPNELLSAIFELGYDAYSSDDPASGNRLIPFEFVVTHVTQHWRSVALACPFIWTKILIDTRNYHFRDLTTQYIDRSMTLPLNIRLLCFAPDWEGDGFDLNGIMRILFATVGRWDRLRCEFNTLQDMEELLDSLPLSAPTLRHLEIRCHRNFERELMEPTYPRSVFTQGAPLLQSIHFFGITLHSCFPPVSGVTHLHYQAPFENIRPTWAYHTFSDLTLLTHLVLSVINFTDWQDDLVLGLPSLTSLYLRSMWDYDRVLKALAAPSLQSLYLGSVDGVDLDRISLQFHSSPPGPRFPVLQYLTVQSFPNGSIRVPIWNSFIAVLPSIRHFTFLNKNIKSFIQVFSDTSHSTGASGRWPSLQTLSLPNSHSTFDMRLILAMKERKLAGYPVKILKLRKGFKFARVLEGVCDVMQYNPAIDPGYEVRWLDNDVQELEGGVVESEDEVVASFTDPDVV